MKSASQTLPVVLITLLAGAALWHGPIAQLPHYHDFADQHVVHGIPHFDDVLSNIGFALVALWGACTLPQARDHESLTNGWHGYLLFLIGLFFTAFGSSWYHLDPGNGRLFWDRLPIAMACGGLLAGVWGDVNGRPSKTFATWMATLSVYSVGVWYFTEITGHGDLRAYLMFQIVPMLLIPIWQWTNKSPMADRLSFGVALLLYAAAKLTEINDHEIAQATGLLTGHTLKHLLATAAAALIVARLSFRVRVAKA